MKRFLGAVVLAVACGSGAQTAAAGGSVQVQGHLDCKGGSFVSGGVWAPQTGGRTGEYFSFVAATGPFYVNYDYVCRGRNTGFPVHYRGQKSYRGNGPQYLNIVPGLPVVP